MSREPILAIIVPVYNVEKYLHKCIESILKSSFTNFNLLLIDDGSTDKSGYICDTFAASDSRINVLHKANGGVSSARNVALDYIINRNGIKWITFIDSDDFISTDFISNLFKPVKENNNLDFVQGGCTNFYNESSLYSVEQQYQPIVDNNKKLLLDKIRGLSFSKLFSITIVKDYGLRFDERIKVAEDMIFTIEYIRYVDKYAFSNECGYYYRRHSDSITQSHKREYTETLMCFKHFYKAVTNYKITYSISNSNIRDKQITESLLNTVFTLYRNHYPRQERLYRLRTDFNGIVLSINDISIFKKLLIKILLSKSYILFDVIMSFLSCIKNKIYVKNCRLYDRCI